MDEMVPVQLGEVNEEVDEELNEMVPRQLGDMMKEVEEGRVG